MDERASRLSVPPGWTSKSGESRSEASFQAEPVCAIWQQPTHRHLRTLLWRRTNQGGEVLRGPAAARRREKVEEARQVLGMPPASCEPWPLLAAGPGSSSSAFLAPPPTPPTPAPAHPQSESGWRRGADSASYTFPIQSQVSPQQRVVCTLQLRLCKQALRLGTVRRRRPALEFIQRGDFPCPPAVGIGDGIFWFS